jgi:hypothetical protein
VALLSDSWQLAKQTVLSFIEDDALTRGAAVAFYTATSLAPVLLIDKKGRVVKDFGVQQEYPLAQRPAVFASGNVFTKARRTSSE